MSKVYYLLFMFKTFYHIKNLYNLSCETRTILWETYYIMNLTTQ